MSIMRRAFIILILINFANGLGELISIDEILKHNYKYLFQVDVNTGIIMGLSVVFVAGFGDKTFFMNMIYASINPFWEALLVTLTVSELMNLISLFLGEVIPHFVSRDVIEWVAIVLFAFFGFGLLLQGCCMDSAKLSDEIEAINKEPEKKKNLIEEAKDDNEKAVTEPLLKIKIESEPASAQIVPKEEKKKKSEQELGVFDTWWKYSLAFMVGELGDKSQIATIVITAKYNFIGVFIGTALAQLLLVLCSLFLGKTIANLLTNKQISIISALVFLFFSVLYLLNKFLVGEE